MRGATKVLSLGSEEWSNSVRNSLTEAQEEGFVSVESYWELCALPESVSADVAIFHRSFAKDDLRHAAAYIRRRWPLAKILLLGWNADSLEAPLYDDRERGGISPRELVRLIEASVTAQGRIGRDVKPAPGSVCAQQMNAEQPRLVLHDSHDAPIPGAVGGVQCN
jgi:hypothetical protein